MIATIPDLDNLLRKLGSIERLQDKLEPPMTRSLAYLQDDIAQYPRKAQGAFSRLATPGQRRAYWARVRSGIIRHREGVGYVRSGDTGRKWTTEVRRVTGGVRGILGNNSPGARWVHGKDTQQPFHRESGWLTDEKVLQDNADKIRREFQRVINRELSK